MALFGSKKEMEKALNTAKAESEHRIAEKEKEMEKLRAERSAVEDDLKRKIAELEQEIQKRDESLSTISNAHEDEIEKLNKTHIDEISVIRKESAIQAQQMIEFIDTRKEELDKKTDKELLISSVMALDGYAGRMERLEKNLEYHNVLSLIEDMKKEFSESIEKTKSLFLEKMEARDLFEKIDQMQTKATDQLTQMNTEVTSQIKANTDDLTQKMHSMNTLLTDLMKSLRLPEKLEGLSGQIDELYEKLSDKVDELEESITKKINAYDLSSGIESLQRAVKKMDETIDDISEATEKTSDWLENSGLMYNSSDITDALRVIDELKSEVSSIGSIREDVTEIKNSVCDSWSSDSISSKLESIESSIRDLGYTVEAAKDAAERAADRDSSF